MTGFFIVPLVLMGVRFVPQGPIPYRHTRGEDPVGKIVTLRVSSTSRSTSTSRGTSDYATDSTCLKTNPRAKSRPLSGIHISPESDGSRARHRRAGTESNPIAWHVEFVLIAVPDKLRAREIPGERFLPKAQQTGFAVGPPPARFRSVFEQSKRRTPDRVAADRLASKEGTLGSYVAGPRLHALALG